MLDAYERNVRRGAVRAQRGIRVAAAAHQAGPLVFVRHAERHTVQVDNRFVFHGHDTSPGVLRHL
jgi:hypothetical protein